MSPDVPDLAPPISPSGNQVAIRHGEQEAVVVEVGGGLRTYQARGQHALDGYGPDELCPSARGQILIPWPNRLRDGRYGFAGRDYQLPLSEPARGNAIHGLVRWANWRVAEHEHARVVMEHVLHGQDGYPFCLALAVEYTLSDTGLSVHTTALNVGSAPCPFGAGAHPYLAVGTDRLDPCLLQIPAGVVLETDDRSVPTGAVPVDGGPFDFRTARPIGDSVLDTGFYALTRDDDGRARIRLAAPNGERALALWLDEAYPWVMAFTGDSLPHAERRRRGLGVEPMSCAPNALQSGDGLRVLEPGERFEGAWGIELSGEWAGS